VPLFFLIADKKEAKAQEQAQRRRSRLHASMAWQIA